MLTKRYNLLLLSAAVLAAYLPAVYADFSLFDDRALQKALQERDGWNLGELFLPGGLYYRPLIGLSFIIDKHAVGLSPSLMHLENILLHLANALLVFFITRKIVSADDKTANFSPLLAALFFGLHPVNSESINWISGRTDVLACFFILASTLILIHYIGNGQRLYLALSMLCFLGGVLTKETALAFLPGFVLILMSGRKTAVTDHHDATVTRVVINTRTAFVFASFAVVSFFFLVRSDAFQGHAGQIGMTARFMTNDLLSTLTAILQTFGFYVKKLVFPWPLNFAIVEIDPLYDILGAAIAAFCVYAATRKDTIAALFTAGVLFIAPAFLTAFGQIAWTRYAERYVYITSAFVSISSVSYFAAFMEKRSARLFQLPAIILLGSMLILTFERSLVWQNDLRLCKDTVEKSPFSSDARVAYGSLLTQHGDYDEAMKQLETGKSLPFIGYDERFDLAIAKVLYKQGRIDEAEKQCELVFKKSKGSSRTATGYLSGLAKEKLLRASSRKERNDLNKQIFFYNLHLYKLDHDPHLLYDLGITAEALGDNERASKLYRQTLNNLPPGTAIDY